MKKNKMCFRFLCLILAAVLTSSCMGLRDTTPMLGTPQVRSFTIVNMTELIYELTATFSKKEIANIADGGFYVSSYKSMQNAMRIEGLKQGRSLQATIALEAEGQKVYVCAYINSGHYEICSEIKTVTAGETKHSLSAANCHMVSKAGSYDFPAVKGNGTESVGVVKSVDVLWESFGTSITPEVGDLIKTVSYRDDNVIFSTADTFREGNAVIAARDESGTILWSWHIWLTDEPEEQVYYNNAGIMMDRNLGATSATPSDVGVRGLLYQWGRKDPFLGLLSNYGDDVKSTIMWPTSVESSSTTNISYSIMHPLTFIEDGNYSADDWLCSIGSNVDNTRWQSKKTIYDPCPAGWRVPDGGENGVWVKASGLSDYVYLGYDHTNEGINFSGVFGNADLVWYPDAGYRMSSRHVASGGGKYWTTTPNGFRAYTLCLASHGSLFNDDRARYQGNSVRCLQE